MVDQSEVSGGTPRPSRRKALAVIVMALLIVVPAAFGFAFKLFEFFETLTVDADGRFAIFPIMNYVLVTSGFVCILVWATAHGMFRDIEKPKYRMLEQEGRIDEADQREGGCPL